MKEEAGEKTMQKEKKEKKNCYAVSNELPLHYPIILTYICRCSYLLSCYTSIPHQALGSKFRIILKTYAAEHPSTAEHKHRAHRRPHSTEPTVEHRAEHMIKPTAE